MNTGKKELESVLSKLDSLGLKHMKEALQSMYNQPDFVNIGRLELISAIIDEEYRADQASKYESRLKNASLKGTACSLELCVDSKERKYQPIDIVSTLASLEFIREGLNLCIFGASDSGKTYLAKAIGAEACREFRTEYHHCENLIGDLATIRKDDFVKYKKKIRHLRNLDLLILDDFLLHPITDDYEIKALYDILESRNEAEKSCVICSQRDPKSWPIMLMEDEVSYNSILKRVTKNYTVMIEKKSVD